ncbi:MAG: hypothetical protein CL920_02115 [Deltaproteobacteria bacterium]|nr:hypothetical protein [Deltaproteobacteria bacterium]
MANPHRQAKRASKSQAERASRQVKSPLALPPGNRHDSPVRGLFGTVGAFLYTGLSGRRIQKRTQEGLHLERSLQTT